MSEEKVQDSENNTQESKPAAPPKKKRRWLRWTLYVLAGFLVLLTGLYFYISSAAFIRGQVFSRVQEKLNQPLTAAEISFSPFSSIEFKDLTLGDDPFLTAGKIKLAYELMPMLSGKINVNEVTFEDAVIDARFNVDGKLNILSKIVEEMEVKKDSEDKKDDKPDESKKEKKAADPLVLNIKNINFKNLKIRYFKECDRRDKENEVELQLDDFTFSLPELKSGEEFTFELSTSVKCMAGEIISNRSKPGFELKKSRLVVKGKSKLSKDLKPELVEIDITLDGIDAWNIGEKLPLQAVQILTDIGLDGDQITINGIKIADPSKTDSAVTVKGSVNSKTQDLDVNLAIKEVDSSLLDLALPALTSSKPFRRWQEALKQSGKISGFGSTVVNFDGTVKGNPSTKVDVAGNLSINKLPMAKLTPGNYSVVPFNTSIKYNATYLKGDNKAELKKLEISVKEDQRSLVSMSLNNPLVFDILNKKIISGKDEKVTFLLDKLNIDYLKSFMGDDERKVVRSGSVSVTTDLVSIKNGSSLYVDLKKFSVTNLSVKQGEGSYLDNVAVTSSSRFGISDLKKLSLEDLILSVSLDGRENVSLKAGGEINLDQITADVDISAFDISEEAARFLPPELIEKFQLKNLNLKTDGIKVAYTKSTGMIVAKGNVKSTDIGLGGEQFAKSFRLSQNVGFDVTFDQSQNLSVKNLELSVEADGKPALDVAANGILNTTSKALNLKFNTLKVSPAARSLAPADAVKKFKLEGINLSTKGLFVDMNSARIIVKGQLASSNIGLGGEMFSTDVDLSHKTEFDLTLLPNKDLDLRKFTMSVLTDGEDAVNIEASGMVKPESKSINFKLKNFNIASGTSKLVPADLVKKFKLKNLNLTGKDIIIDYTDGKAGRIVANLTTKDLELGGTDIKPVKISQTMTVDAVIDAASQLDLKKFNLLVTPANIKPVEVTAHGKVDLKFKKADSKIVIDLPRTVDVNALMALLKEKKIDKAPADSVKPVKATPPEKPASEPTVTKTDTPAAVKKSTPLKLTVQTSVKELIFKEESIKNVTALAYIDGNKYALKEAALQIGQSIVQASAYFENEPNKVINASVKSAGLFDLAPFNRLLNKNTDKHFGGKVEIEQLELKTSGKDSKEIIKNLVASGKMFMQNISVKGYGESIPSIVSNPVEQVFGPDPNDINFKTGKVVFDMKDRLFTLHQCELTGNALLVNPTGSVQITDTAYITDFTVNAGFSGSEKLQFLIQNPTVRQLATEKSAEFRDFLNNFPYKDTYKKFTMADPIVIKKEFKIKTDNPTATESVLGLNTLSAELMNAFFSGVAERADFKELKGVMALGSGDITEGTGALIEGLIKREVNKKLNKDKEDGGSGLGGLLDGILGGGDKKKKKELTEEEKKEAERKEAEEKKKKEEKEKINKEDELIKGIENIFK